MSDEDNKNDIKIPAEGDVQPEVNQADESQAPATAEAPVETSNDGKPFNNEEPQPELPAAEEQKSDNADKNQQKPIDSETPNGVEETKGDMKPETETKESETKTEAKPELTPEIKSEPKPEVKPEVKAEIKPENKNNSPPPPTVVDPTSEYAKKSLSLSQLMKFSDKVDRLLQLVGCFFSLCAGQVCLVLCYFLVIC